MSFYASVALNIKKKMERNCRWEGGWILKWQFTLTFNIHTADWIFLIRAWVWQAWQLHWASQFLCVRSPQRIKGFSTSGVSVYSGASLQTTEGIPPWKVKTQRQPGLPLYTKCHFKTMWRPSWNFNVQICFLFPVDVFKAEHQGNGLLEIIFLFKRKKRKT